MKCSNYYYYYYYYYYYVLFLLIMCGFLLLFLEPKLDHNEKLFVINEVCK